MKKLFIIIIFILIIFSNVAFSQEDVYTPQTQIRMYIDILQNNIDYKMRAEASYQLGRIKPESAIEPLIYAMNNDENEIVKITCAYSLGEIENEKSKLALIDIANNSTIPQLKSQALYSLDKLHSENLIDFFLKILENEQVIDVKITCIKILSRHKTNKITETIIKVINNNKDQPIIKEAIIALGRQEKYETKDFLIDIFNKAEIPDIKIASALSLFRINKAANITTNDAYINIVKSYYLENKQQLFSAYALLIMGDRTPIKYMLEKYYNKNTILIEKIIVLEACAKSPFDDAFSIVFDALNSKDETFDITKEYFLRINAEKILLSSNTISLISSISSNTNYYKYLSDILYRKLKTNPESEFKNLIYYFSIENSPTHKPITEVILRLDNTTTTILIRKYIKEPSLIVKMNLIQILAAINTDDAYELIKSNINRKDIDFLIRVFRKIDKINNFRLPELFFKEFTSENKWLRKQALDSIINLISKQVDLLGEMFYKTLGKSNPEIDSFISNLDKYAIIPLYDLFIDNKKNKSLDFIRYIETIKEIDKELLEKALPEKINELLSRNIVTFINDYKLRIYSDSSLYNNLFNILLLPILNKVFLSKIENIRLKLLFIPTFAKVDDDLGSINDVRKYILDEMENPKIEIVLITAENLLYTFRSLYKPLTEERLKDFKRILGKRIIKVAEYLSYYIELNNLKEEQKLINFPNDYLKRIIVGLERTLSEAVVVDKDLYLSLIKTNLEPIIKKNLISKLNTILDYDEVKSLLIELLYDENASIRYEALILLSEYIKETKILNIFLDKLSDVDDNIRNFVINTIATQNESKVISIVVKNLESNNQILVDSSIKLLAIIGDKSVGILSDFLKTDISKQTKKNIIKTLVEIGTDSAINILGSLKNDADEEIRKMVSEILINISTKKNTNNINDIIEILDEKNIDELIKSEDEKNIIIDSIELLIKSLNTNDEIEYERIIKNLVKVGLKSIDMIIKNLENSNYKIRKGLETTLFLMGKDAVFSYLIDAFNIENSNITQSLINILSMFEINIIEDLLSVINSDKIKIRYGVVYVLGKIKHYKAIYPLIIMAKDTEWHISVIAKRFLKTNFSFSDKEIAILLNLNSDELSKIKDMNIDEIRKTYLNGDLS